MTAQLYQDWIQQWDRQLQARKRKILLLQDNFSGHIIPPDLQSIKVKNFRPNLTAHIQPNDQGIIWCFKAHYRARFIQQAIDRYDEGITPSKIYEINQLQAMRIAEAAWRDVDSTTIQNCWHKARILPETCQPSHTPHTAPLTIPIATLVHDATSQMDPITHVEKQVEFALNDLVSRGVLQHQNQMDITALLNPHGKSYVLTEANDNDIYHAMMDAIDTCKNIDHNGGDDVDQDGPIEPCPSRREVLTAVSTILQYVANLNDPLARKVEGLLGSLTRLLHIDAARSMHETVLTDFFSPS